MEKRYLLSEPIEHIENTSFDATPIIDYRGSASMADNKQWQQRPRRKWSTIFGSAQSAEV
jgi:hypothetical protein